MSEAETQRDRDAAQADLEEKVGQLKELVTDKVDSVKRPFEWLAEHGWMILLGVAVGFVVHSLLRSDELDELDELD